MTDVLKQAAADARGWLFDHALPVWTYIIVSVESGKAVDIRAWEMENDRSKFNEEEFFTDTKELFAGG